VSSHSTLRYTNLDGSGTTDINISCASGVNPHWQAPWNGVNKIVVDEINGKIYWENSFEPGVGRSNLDGTDCELVANGGYYGKGQIALDETGTYLYSVQNNTIRRITVADGTVTNLTFSGQGISLSNLGDMVVSNGKLYVAISNVGSAGHIMEATLDTSSSTQTARLLVTSQPTGMSGLDIDAVNSKIYWATGSAVKRANLDGTSIATVYTGSVGFVQVLSAESKILMGAVGNSNMFVTDLNGGNVTTLNAKAGSLVTAVVTNVAPPTTTTTTTTTVAPTTTTVAPTTTTTTTTTTTSTTVAPTTTSTSTTVAIAVATPPVVTVAQGQASVATIAPRVGPTTTVLNPMRSQVPQTTTTTVRPVVKNAALPPTAVAAVAPVAPALTPGTAGALIGGKAVAATVSRASNQITAMASDITTTISGLTSDGQRVALNPEGNLVVNEGDKLVVDAAGYAPDADVSVWLYSSPTRLGVIAADSDGKVSGSFDLPSDLEVGDHRLVLSGENPNGVKALLGLGLSYGTVESGSSITRVLIAIPIALAVLFGLFLPAVTRRRRKRLVAA